MKNDIQLKFGNININKVNEIENNIKSNITEEVNESIIGIKSQLLIKGGKQVIEEQNFEVGT